MTLSNRGRNALNQPRIVKLTGGLYTVALQDGTLVSCKPKGLFRHHDVHPKVGDWVTLEGDTIATVATRKNDFVRPQIANVDQVLLIASFREPDFSFLLLDRFLALIFKQDVEVVIIVTKIDLADKDELTAFRQTMRHYETICPVVYVTSKEKDSLIELLPLIEGKVNVVAGQTGAGKSSLLNSIQPDLELATDIISKALGRGKHTTRHVELIPFGDGWIADTPGFSKLEFDTFEAAELKDLYPDFIRYRGQCRFENCIHVNEPGCAVKAAVKTGAIPKERHENYVRLYEEIASQKPKYPR
jgi:ribosome biogenesis GTPase